jgi:hypothetical protein
MTPPRRRGRIPEIFNVTLLKLSAARAHRDDAAGGPRRRAARRVQTRWIFNNFAGAGTARPAARRNAPIDRFDN